MAQRRVPAWRAHCIGFLLAVCIAGCATVSRQPQSEAQQGSAPPVVGEAVESAASPPTLPPPPAVAQSEPAAVATPAAPDAAPQPRSSESSAPKPELAPTTPAAKPELAPATPAAKPATPAAAPPRSTPKAAATPPKPAGPPPLDLKSLETRLRETKAIGVYTKLTLKNQVDDLLDSFRAYYKGQAKSTLADLRRAYDLLVLKVIALLQDADPPLASAIATSRESIWGILSDPAKFAAV